MILDARPPWYYFFYFGNIGSFIILAIIVVGFLVFFLTRKRKGMIIFKRLGFSAALFFILSYMIYNIYLMI